jgi:hypothetical protein
MFGKWRLNNMVKVSVYDNFDKRHIGDGEYAGNPHIEEYIGVIYGGWGMRYFKVVNIVLLQGGWVKAYVDVTNNFEP